MFCFQFTKVAKLKEIMKSTLFAIQNENIDELLTEALNKLIKDQFLLRPSEVGFIMKCPKIISKFRMNTG